MICKKLFVVFTSLKVIFDRSNRRDICRERSYPESDISQLESCQRNQRRSDGAGRPYFLRTLESFWNEILAQSKTKRTSFQGKCKKLCTTENCTRSSQNFTSLLFITHRIVQIDRVSRITFVSAMTIFGNLF